MTIDRACAKSFKKNRNGKETAGSKSERGKLHFKKTHNEEVRLENFNTRRVDRNKKKSVKSIELNQFYKGTITTKIKRNYKRGIMDEISKTKKRKL